MDRDKDSDKQNFSLNLFFVLLGTLYRYFKNKYFSDLVWVLKVIYEYMKKKKKIISHLVDPKTPFKGLENLQNFWNCLLYHVLPTEKIKKNNVVQGNKYGVKR